MTAQTEGAGVPVWKAIENERARAKAMKAMHKLPGSSAPRKRAKTYTQREVGALVAAAVAAKVDAIDRELRRLIVEFPKDRAGLKRAHDAVLNIGAHP